MVIFAILLIMIKKAILNLLFFNCYAYKAIVVVPVADLLGQPSQNINPNKFYNQLNPSTELGACYRINQSLFNEIVDVIQERGPEVEIATQNCFIKNSVSDRYNKFWTLKSNILPLNDIEINKISNILSQITLIRPFRYKNLIFSAGTNFVVQVETKNSYKVFILNTKTKDFDLVDIPKNYTFEPSDNKINDFIRILKSWTNRKKVIPYVWGGTSFCKIYKKHKNASEFHKFLSKNETIKSGMDCAGLILRAAQIAGIPYFYKNTTTLAANLPKIKKIDSIKNGDLIFFPGHVIIISDIDKNLCIEARGYNHGYGIVQEIPLNQLFRNINNFDELRDAYFKHQTLERLNSEGIVIQNIKNFQILKFN